MSDLCKHLPGHIVHWTTSTDPWPQRRRKPQAPRLFAFVSLESCGCRGLYHHLRDNHHSSHTSKSKEYRELNVEDTKRERKMKKQRAHKKRREQLPSEAVFIKLRCIQARGRVRGIFTCLACCLWLCIFAPGAPSAWITFPRTRRSPLSLSMGDSLHSMQTEWSLRLTQMRLPRIQRTKQENGQG